MKGTSSLSEPKQRLCDHCRSPRVDEGAAEWVIVVNVDVDV